MPLPNRLATLRHAAQLTLEQLGDEIGRDATTIGRWERATVGIPDEYKVALARRFGVTVGHLMQWPSEDQGEAAA